MKIEEILEHLSATQKINNGWTSFSVEECKGLYDYITNLQKENKQLKKKYENAVADYELEKYKNSKARECINYYAIEDDDFNKLYDVEEQELLEILGDKENANTTN